MTSQMGRPTAYSKKVADKICEEIVIGRSLRSICQDEDMPSISSVIKWLGEKEDFSAQYARAKEEQADTLTDDMEDIARDNNIDVARARLIIDTRKWAASKLKPKKYGDKIDMTTNGKDLPTPILGGMSVDKSPDDISSK